MTKRKLIKYVSLASLGLAAACLMPSTHAKEETPADPAYYVCFSYDNYQVKNTNKMTAVDTDSDGVTDYYTLTNKSLSSSMDFYVISNTEEKYFGSDGTNMKVTDSDSYKYNLFFSPTEIYDAEHIINTDYYESNCHITYDYYVPGHFSLSVDGAEMEDFSYNHYITSYDAYILPEATYAAGSVITVTDLDNGTNYTKTVENAGNYRLVFTPTSTKNSNEYRFDADGNYGTGDEYTENMYISDVEYYYISYNEDVHAQGDVTTFTLDDKTISGYRLLKDETKPSANVFKGDRIFNNEEDHDLEYTIYHYSYIFGKYEVIDDDNDKDTDVSEKTLSDVSWYTCGFSFAEGTYTTAFTRDDTDFGGYYMVGEFNNYGFNSDGTLNLDEKYLFSEVAEDSSYYDEDNKQFLLSKFVIKKDMLDYDDDDYVFQISNGKVNTTDITIKTPGTYDILYSTETNYNGSAYKYVRTEESEEVYSTYTIASIEDFLTFVDQWNMDSESSKYVIYELTADLDFRGVTLSSISMFNGTLNGNGHSLSYISISEENECDEIGLFKLVTKYATIRDIEIKDLSIIAEKSEYVGFITKNYGRLENITIDGEVSGSRYVGALVGYNGNYQQDSDTSADSTVKYGYGVLENVTNNAKVTGKIIVGGLTGFNGGKIIHSSNAAEINHKSYSSSVTVMNIGGLAGYSTGEIVDSWNTGVVGYSQIASNVGGIAGLENGEIYYSYNTGVVYGKSNVGGIAGYFGSQSSDSSETTSTEDQIQSQINSVMNPSANEEDYTEETDISSHVMYYCYNTGDVHATNYVGGLIGYANASTLSVKNSVSMCSAYADSGSYVGGLTGYLNAGEIISSAFLGYVEANGSINRYVGGIAGYSNGTVTACIANATLNGTEYVGGIVGYATSSAKVNSCYADVYMITKSTASYVGNIAGFIDGMDSSSGTYGDRVTYNYYLGSDLNDYSGINNVNYGKASHYAASRYTFSDAAKKNFLSSVSHRFGEHDDDENYFIEGEYLPYLASLSILDEVDDDDFDDDTDSYDTYASYFEKNKELYAEFQKQVAEFNIRIVYKEWDSELDDNEYDNYKVVKIDTISYRDGISAAKYPDFIYVDNGNRTTRNDMMYTVSWAPVTQEFKNQTIYAEYTGMKNSMYDSESKIYVEGDFTLTDTLVVTKSGTFFTVTILRDGKALDAPDLVVKVYSSSPERCIITVNRAKVSTTVYGSYVQFSLSGTDTFEVTQGPFTFSMLPDYVIALIFIIPVLLLIIIGVVISNVRSYKKDKAAKANAENGTEPKPETEEPKAEDEKPVEPEKDPEEPKAEEAKPAEEAKTEATEVPAEEPKALEVKPVAETSKPEEPKAEAPEETAAEPEKKDSEEDEFEKAVREAEAKGEAKNAGPKEEKPVTAEEEAKAKAEAKAKLNAERAARLKAANEARRKAKAEAEAKAKAEQKPAK